MKGSEQMHFGVSMFHTDYSMPAVQLARALEERGFESMWAPEHRTSQYRVGHPFRAAARYKIGAGEFVGWITFFLSNLLLIYIKLFVIEEGSGFEPSVPLTNTGDHF
jgi:alkanesulfonate monooxygenase SsuD/methylene tetrahydromethanopterin reductase-like flavin-dependent oxidoreductase (luciferase family)